MKILKNKNYKTILMPVLIIGALLLVCIASAFFLKLWPFQNNIDPNSIRQETSSESSKNDNPITKDESEADANEGKSTDDVPVSESFSAAITKLEQNDNQISFAAKISNSKNPGTCVVTFSNPNDRPIVKQFDSTSKDSVTLCESTFSALEFSYLGEWNVSLRYYVGSEQAFTEGRVIIK